MRRLFTLLLIAALGGGAAPPDQAAQKEQLAKVQKLVGTWRGVAQPQRGSTKDSWLEEAEWSWSFPADGPALVATLPKARYFRQLTIACGREEGQYMLTAAPASEGEGVQYTGALDNEQQLVFSLDPPRDDLPARMSFRFVAGGDRLLVLLERKEPTSGRLVRLAEVGYTRQGSGFGKGSLQRECIVTGGLGTIAVTHGGQTYYVCCTGCREYFYENPEKVLAEYAARTTAQRTK